MRVLITGAAGFLGSHLSKRYLDAGHKVLGVDNFSSSSDKSGHFLDLIKTSNFEFEEADIARDWFSRIAGSFDPKLILNFACPASPPIYQKEPIKTMLTCVIGTTNVLDIARRCGSVVVHASTSEVYGDPTVSPQPETYRGNVNPYGPRACYDEGKRAAESLSFDYLNKYNVDARLVRIFNTYGPHMDPQDGRVVSNMICQAIRGQALTVYGKGDQTRSFCYVDDLVDGIIKLANLENNPRSPINIGNVDEFTILELANAVREVSGKNLDIEYQPLPKDDPMQRRPDTRLANSVLSWSAKVRLADGLKSTYEYFKKVVG